MWIFQPDGFFSAVEHRDNPDMILVRCRAKVHAQRLLASLPEAERPELVETPPPADYRWRAVLTRVQWVYVVARWAAGIDYGNFKNEAHKRKHPVGFMSALHRVWDEMLAFQDDQNPLTRGGRWKKTYGLSLGSLAEDDRDPFGSLDRWLGRRAAEAVDADDEVVELDDDDIEVVDIAEGMFVRLFDDPEMGDGEVLSVDEQDGTALVRFVTEWHLPDGGVEPEEDVVRVPLQDIERIEESFDPAVIDEIADQIVTSSRPEPETFTSLDNYAWDGSWPEPEPAGFLRGR